MSIRNWGCGLGRKGSSRLLSIRKGSMATGARPALGSACRGEQLSLEEPVSCNKAFFPLLLIIPLETAVIFKEPSCPVRN